MRSEKASCRLGLCHLGFPGSSHVVAASVLRAPLSGSSGHLVCVRIWRYHHGVRPHVSDPEAALERKKDAPSRFEVGMVPKSFRKDGPSLPSKQLFTLPARQISEARGMSCAFSATVPDIPLIPVFAGMG